MKNWLKRFRGALSLGVIWAIAWGSVGFLMEIFVDPHGRIVDIWPAVLGLPAFFGGVFFSAVLGFAERRHRFDELKLSRVAAWGAVGGVLVGLLPFVLGEPTGDVNALKLALMIVPPISLLSAISAAGSLAIARMSDARESLDGRSNIAELPDTSTRERS